jgi:ADP-heptose:LPS heptosyltransferase
LARWAKLLPADHSEIERNPGTAGSQGDVERGEIIVMKKLLLKHFLSPGDIVMLTAAVRDLHQCYPNQFLTDVRTACPPLWENNPYITALNETDADVEAIECHYPLINRSNQAPYHCLHGFIEFLNEHLKLNIKPTAFKGDIHLSELEKSWYSQVHELTGEDTPFWIIVAGGKQDATIKWWSTERYQQVVDHFLGKIQFVQVGQLQHHHPKLGGVIDLRAKTDLRQLVRLVYHAQGVLCPVTCLMHLAAAVEVKGGKPSQRPCVVVAGGREPPHWEAYPNHQFLHTVGMLPCDNGGCWRARTVALGDGDERDQAHSLCVDVVDRLPRCMHLITAAEVIRRIEMYYEGAVLDYLTPPQAKAAREGVELSNRPEASFNVPVILRSDTRPATMLLQQASGRYTRMLDVSGSSHNAYAARHGLTFCAVRGDLQCERAAHWNKVLLIQRALENGFELVVWLDADTLIVNLEADLREALGDGPPIGMCRHPIPWEEQPWHFNSGVIFVRNTPLAHEFFQRVWDAGPVQHRWQEQLRINQVSGQMPAAVQAIDAKWNSTLNVNACKNPVIQAWHGIDHADTVRRMKVALRSGHARRSNSRPVLNGK